MEVNRAFVTLDYEFIGLYPQIGRPQSRRSKHLEAHGMEYDINLSGAELKARVRRVLIAANGVMVGMIVVHDVDHVRQAANWCYTIGLSVWVVNISVYVPSAIALAMAWRGWRGAAAMTSVNGLLVGAAFSEVHLWRPSIPLWGLWNDNFFILGADWISWTILALTVLVGACVAMAGAYAMGLNWVERRASPIS